MANHNCLKGVRCPECGSEDSFRVDARVTVQVTDDGIEDCGGDYEWSPDAFTQCDACDFGGPMSAFTICEECERQHGPHFRGACTHAEPPATVPWSAIYHLAAILADQERREARKAARGRP